MAKNKTDLLYRVPKPKSNEQFIIDLMRDSVHGQFTVAFITEAIAVFAKKISEIQLKEEISNHTIISDYVWKDIAKEILEKFKQRNQNDN